MWTELLQHIRRYTSVQGELVLTEPAGCKMLLEGMSNGTERDLLCFFLLCLSGLGLSALPYCKFGFIYMRLILGYLCQAYVYSC